MMKNLINSISHKPKILVFILLLWTSLVYVNSFNNTFVIDDQIFIVDWPLIKNLNNLPEFFGSNNQPEGEEGVYSPLKTCFHALNYHLWGLNPIGHHLVALLIHIIGTLFVYRLSILLTNNSITAFLCGLFFGLHPIHVEAVTFLTASIDTLGVVFLYISCKQNRK